jgi:hypothetical protein
VVIDDFDLVGITAFPAKADAPLIVDADTMLALPWSNQLLKSIGRRDPEVVGRFRSVQDQELAKSYALNPRELPRMAPLKDLFGLATAEALDHASIISPDVIIVKRYQVA